MRINLKNVIDIFNEKYGNLTVEKIYKVSDGYLVYAPKIKNGPDYSDPYYLVSTDMTKVTGFRIDRLAELSKALVKGPIWER